VTQSRAVLARYSVSAIIVVILATQAFAGFVNTGRWGWPMIAYPMYSTAHFEGERLNHDLTAHAVLADSTRVPMGRDDVDMAFWIYWYNVVQAIRQGDLTRLEPVLRRYCQEFDNQVVRFVVEDSGVAIGRDGPVEGLPPETIYETDVTCP
jgi:hypothetical protein